MSNIKSVTPIGEHQTYDLEVDHPDHQFYLANGILTSNSHAVAYAIDSYYCAYLMRYYEEEWLCAYLESMSGNDDAKAKAFSEVRALGYQIVPIDVMHASDSWTALPGKKLMPSLIALTGFGNAAAAELDLLRPFETIEELLWNEDGSWRPSKLNKKALEALVNVKAFNSLDIIGEDKLFKNYAHLYEVLIEHNSEIKKTSKKDPFVGKKRFYELAKELSDIEPWDKNELIARMIKHFGTLDVSQLISKDVVQKLDSSGVKSIDDYSSPGLYWFFVTKATPKKTKNGKNYLILEIVGPGSKVHKMFMWGWDGSMMFERYSCVLGEVSSSEFGFASTQRKLRILDV